MKNNQHGKNKQKEYYDKGTKLRYFELGVSVYLKEVTIGKQKL